MDERAQKMTTEEKKKAAYDMIEKIYKAFAKLQEESNPRASLRVKLLIKNMFENRATGWVKSKEDDKEIKKKAEVESTVLKQAQDKQRESE